MKENLAPCCHAAFVAVKTSQRVNFQSALTRFAVDGKQDQVAKLAQALDAARDELFLDRATAFQDKMPVGVDFIAQYIQKVVFYLSLVKGFTISSSRVAASIAASANASSDTDTNKADNNHNNNNRKTSSQSPEAQSKSNASTSTNATSSSNTTSDIMTSSLAEPLMNDKDQGATAPGIEPADQFIENGLSGLFNFTEWTNVLTNCNVFALNARHEISHTLLACGILLMNQGMKKVDDMLQHPVATINENDLKLAYQLFLNAAGVLDACSTSLGVAPHAIGAEVSDLSGRTNTNNNKSDRPASGPEPNNVSEEAMAKWRQEQRQESNSLPVPSEASTSPSALNQHEDLARTVHIADLAHGSFSQALSWIALAQAQELVILRGITRDFVDHLLLSKLAMDISSRYKECHDFMERKLPCVSSDCADQLRWLCAFKNAYYDAISVYYQGAACLEKETQSQESQYCAQAIANFKKASVLMEEACHRKFNYDQKFAKQDLTSARKEALDRVFLRSQQIVQRDLDIMTHRNDTVYYERIPDPEAPSAPLGLVREIVFPEVPLHEFWLDPNVATCLQPGGGASGKSGSATAAAAAAGDNATTQNSSCCHGCAVM